ncbi:hypothetical protein [Caldicoprobacter algeriensis]|uniref:hypothetical protein n=1 Tax=Caldicoprobacter algeriensis TaxID=699281 RepID=UPI002079A459|nr:hypothetical protein [Caldicoprobacter algeriensis]
MDEWSIIADKIEKIEPPSRLTNYHLLTIQKTKLVYDVLKSAHEVALSYRSETLEYLNNHEDTILQFRKLREKQTQELEKLARRN